MSRSGDEPRAASVEPTRDRAGRRRADRSDPIEIRSDPIQAEIRSIRSHRGSAPDDDDVHPAACHGDSDFPEVAAQVAVASDSTLSEVDANERGREPAEHVGRTLGGAGVGVATANIGG